MAWIQSTEGQEHVTWYLRDGRYQQPTSVFRCPVCEAVSYNPNDLREGYCGRCHAFTGERAATATAGLDSEPGRPGR